MHLMHLSVGGDKRKMGQKSQFVVQKQGGHIEGTEGTVRIN